MAFFSENIVLVQIVGTIAILITGTIGASAAPILDAVHRYRKRKKGHLDSAGIEDGTEAFGEEPPLTGFDYYMPLITLILKTVGTGVVLATALMHVLPDGLDMVAEGNIEMKDKFTHQRIINGFYINATETCASNPGNCYVEPNHERSHDHDDHHQGPNHHHDDHHEGPNHHHDDHHEGPNHHHDEDGHVHHHHHHDYPYGMLFSCIVILLTFILEVEMRSLVNKARDATMIVYMTEVGMVVHSLPIGVAFAIITDVDSLNALVIALCVHQLCEGCAMGPLIQAGAKSTLHAISLIFLYSASVPVGVVIGAIIKNNGGYSRGRTALLVEGILKCVAGGLLVYISTVEFLAELMTLLTGHGGAHGHGGHTIVNNGENKVTDNETNEGVQEEVNPVMPIIDYTKNYPIFTRIICHVSLFLGFASMAIVALWA